MIIFQHLEENTTQLHRFIKIESKLQMKYLFLELMHDSWSRSDPKEHKNEAAFRLDCFSIALKLL